MSSSEEKFTRTGSFYLKSNELDYERCALVLFGKSSMIN